MSAVFGLGLMVGGSALLVLSLEQHERILGASYAASLTCPSATVVATAPSVTTQPTVTASAKPTVSVAPSAAPSASVAASASASASAQSAPADSPLAYSFAFMPNDVVLQKEDLERLKAFGVKLRASRAKLSIEAFQDDGSPDTPAKNLAKRRIAIVREVLTAIGVPPERILPTPTDSPVSPGKAVVRLTMPLEGTP
ncbi:MAG: hypothetical protein U0165_18390 [Polyangiaceae bacterium]